MIIWTEEQLEILQRDWTAGVAARDIAANLGFQTNTVQNKAHHLGFHRPDWYSTSWTPEMERKLIFLLDAGYSRSAAARELGVSKNSAIAKALRIGWQPPEPEKPRGLTLADLQPQDCRYPYGDRVPYSFCGARKQHGSSYCPQHNKLTHRAT